MKIILWFLFNLALPSILFSQVSLNLDNKSVFSPKYFLPQGDVINIADSIHIIKQKTRIQLLSQNGDSLFISLMAGNSIGIVGERNHGYINLDGRTQFQLDFRDWDFQALVIPIKIRPSIEDSPLEFIGDYALGSYLGYQWGSKTISMQKVYTYSSTISSFAAPTMIRINPEVASTSESNLVLGFSLGLGYLFTLNSYQIGIVGGVDYISGEASKTWIYQGQPWFSFVLGFDFNDEESR